MQAYGRPFEVIGTMGFLDIPFFQRSYVWDEMNWDGFLKSILDTDGSEFLGSIILKAQPHASGDPERVQVIDGQQRLTTFNIMLKALDDSFGNADLMPDTKGILFYTRDKFSKESKKCRLNHSRLDRSAYEKVMFGKREEIEALSGESLIIKCYKYFAKAFAGMSLDDRRALYNRLFDHDRQVWVVIDLNQDDSEQAIFDTINTAGVRLTIADTIKNYLFQRYLDLSDDKDEVYRAHDEYWEKIFSDDEECLHYWAQNRNQGRCKRTSQEVFLQCVAIIKGIFDPQEKGSSLSKLAEYYKRHIDSLKDVHEVRSLVVEIRNLAQVYREFFVDFDEDELLRWDDPCKRVLHILESCETSTFDPLILKLVMDSKNSGAGGGVALEKMLDELSSYVMRHVVAGASVKNFNKECVAVIKGAKTISAYLAEKKASGDIDDASVRRGLLTIKKGYNKVAKEILLWMEIKRRAEVDAQFRGVPANYKSDLEHIMPQKWEEYWPVNNPQVVDPESGEVVDDQGKAIQLRRAAILEIGNMSLLNKKLNRHIQNREINVKINGDGAGISGIGLDKVDFGDTRDVIRGIVDTGYLWNEKAIRDRSKRLSDVFLSLW